MKKGIKVGRKKILFIEEFFIIDDGKTCIYFRNPNAVFCIILDILKKTGSATLFDSVIVIRLIPQILLTPLTGVQ
ncbi:MULTISPECIES: hypothetical protein [unclassified Clostridium]|uniref:hypothetical protein n=1 Tax=unclassified Clostridium TaxID=2614128 RepID=UPI00216376FE|nr:MULTISPECIES: hypothetical protein [unclassified Clostridium]